MEDSVIVEFDMSEKTWNLVVVEGKENKHVVSEGVDTFTVEYEKEEDFHEALNRFDGMVEYRIQ